MDTDPGQTLLLVVLQNVILLAATLGVFWIGVIVLRALGRGTSFSLVPLGFSKPTSGYGRGLMMGVFVGVAAILVGLALNVSSSYALEALGYPGENDAQQSLIRDLESFVSESPAVAVPVIFLVVALVGPAVEELVFRGAVFGGLYRLGRLFARGRGAGEGPPGRTAERWAFFLAAALSSAFFASLHLEPAIFLAIFTLAVGLCWLLKSTGSLLPPIAAHVTFNSFTVALVMLGGLGVVPSQ